MKKVSLKIKLTLLYTIFILVVVGTEESPGDTIIFKIGRAHV